ncbi:sunset domain-containing protein [Mariluticola halotolerans]|uniref:sunset domain-containing protein n=1 Tax=Mariluticola halotolerans TaxID=2909283 RepID=UPI0026E2697A|nr:hypothetical protein [Mariluticola halotolerans]UJQ95522.1 hypothetical protein L1P08_05915 [Mariluticola halotolerans]
MNFSRLPLVPQLLLVSALPFGAVTFVLSPDAFMAGTQSMSMQVVSGGYASAGECVIKGNISINSGKHIYHVPGQEFYTRTRISPEYGERWFCSEAEAQAAGWHKARR